MKTKTIWKVLSWVFLLCGLSAFALAWLEVFTGSVYGGMPSVDLFYDAIAAGVFAIFFLAWSSIGARR